MAWRKKRDRGDGGQRKRRRTSFLQGPFADYTFRRALIWPRASGVSESPSYPSSLLFADLTAAIATRRGRRKKRENPAVVVLSGFGMRGGKRRYAPLLPSPLALHVWLCV